MEALAATGGLPRDALHSQLAAAVQVVLHMRRLRSGARVLDAVGVLGRDDGTRHRPTGVDPLATAGPTERAALGELLAERGVSPPW